MKLTKLNDNIFLFTSETMKELTLSFFRVQEYYESQKPALNRKEFTVFDFLNEQMNDKGEIDYFSYWTGFNVPGKIFSEWMDKNKLEFTPFEMKMISQLDNAGINPFHGNYYVIGSLETDIETIDHEIAHALYETNPDYKSDMDNLNIELLLNHNDIFETMHIVLLELGYSEDVIHDEIQAYISSSNVPYLKKEFQIPNIPIIKEYKKVLQKYNTFSEALDK